MTDPAPPEQPQPVVNLSRLGGLISAAFVACGGAYFLITQGVTAHNLTAVGASIEGAITAVTALAVYVVAVIHGKAAAARVTPVESPRDAQGRPLAPAIPAPRPRPVQPQADPLAERWEQDYQEWRAEVRNGWHESGGAIPPGPSRTDTQEINRVTQTVQRIPEQVIPDKRLGRHVRHDPRSLSYLVPETATPVTAMWTRRVPVFDQGNLGSCTGNAAAGVLGTDPFYATLPAGLVDDEQEAVSLYSAATKLDNAPGSWPPDDTGSDGLSVAKACQRAGLISGYQHITSVAAAQTAIVSGPFIVGVNWYSSMDNPDADGLVAVGGSIRGGHEFVCDGYDAQADRWWFTNSWGASWGKDGRFCMSSASFARLLSEQGDATVFLPCSQPAPVPTPPQPGPASSGFPLTAYDNFHAHPYSRPKRDEFIREADAWLAGGGQ